jgi:hypothetical protein
MRRIIFFRSKRYVPRYSDSVTIATKSKDYRQLGIYIYIYIYLHKYFLYKFSYFSNVIMLYTTT